MTTFIVEFRLKPGAKSKILDEFERRGPNRNPGVRFRNAWVGTRSDVIFAIGDSEDEAKVIAACEGWNESGEFEIHPVVGIEQY